MAEAPIPSGSGMLTCSLSHRTSRKKARIFYTNRNQRQEPSVNAHKVEAKEIFTMLLHRPGYNGRLT
jgi:hypothetical protein